MDSEYYLGSHELQRLSRCLRNFLRLLLERWIHSEFHNGIYRQRGSRRHDLLLRNHGGGSERRKRVLEYQQGCDSCAVAFAPGKWFESASGSTDDVGQLFMRHPLEFDKPHRRERRHRRFDLQFPVSLNFSSGGAVRELAGLSRNVSIGGLLLKVNDPVPVRTQVNLTMAVHDPRLRRPVQLLGKGAVVRVERLESEAGFTIAIECKRPITEIDEHLPATG